MNIGVGLFFSLFGLFFIVFNKQVGDKAAEYQHKMTKMRHDPVIFRAAYILFGLLFFIFGISVIFGWIILKPRGM